MVFQLKIFANPPKKAGIPRPTSTDRESSVDFPDLSVPRYGRSGHTATLSPSKTPDVLLGISPSAGDSRLLGSISQRSNQIISHLQDCTKREKIMLNILLTEEKIAAENCHIVWSIFNFICEPCK